MAEKMKLSGVPETMLQTIYSRAKESAVRGVCYRGALPAAEKMPKVYHKKWRVIE